MLPQGHQPPEQSAVRLVIVMLFVLLGLQHCCWWWWWWWDLHSAPPRSPLWPCLVGAAAVALAAAAVAC